MCCVQIQPPFLRIVQNNDKFDKKDKDKKIVNLNTKKACQSKEKNDKQLQSRGI